MLTQPKSRFATIRESAERKVPISRAAVAFRHNQIDHSNNSDGNSDSNSNTTSNNNSINNNNNNNNFRHGDNKTITPTTAHTQN